MPKSLNTRLILALVVVAFALAVAVSLGVNREIKKTIIATQKENLKIIGSGLEGTLASNLGDLAEDIQSLAQRKAFQNAKAHRDEVTRILDRTKASFKHFAWLGVTDTAGNIVAASGGLLVGRKVVHRSWYKQGSKGVYFGDVHDAFMLAKVLPRPPSDAPPLRLVDIATPIRDANEQVVGVLAAHLSLEWARELLDSMACCSNAGVVDVIIVGHDGHVILGTRDLAELQGDLTALTSYQMTRTAASAATIDVWPDGKHYLTAAVRDKAREGKPTLGWTIFARRNLDHALRPARDLANLVYLAAVIFILAMAGMTWFLVRRELAPLERVSRAADDIRHHDLTAPIPTVAGDGEIAVFARSLSDLVTTLQNTIEGRMKAEKALNRSQEMLTELAMRMQLAFDTVTVGLVIADQNGFIESFNPAAEAMFGYRADEIIGQNVSLLAGDEHGANHDSYLERYLRTGKAKVIGIGREVPALRKDGTTFPAHLGIAELPAGETRKFIASLTDLSVEKRLEDQLRHAQKMEAVGQLVGGIAHDFNNILGIIRGNLELMRRKIEGDERLEGQTDKALNAVLRGATLTRRLLNFSSQEPLQATDVDANEIIKDVYELIQKSLTITIKVELRLAISLPHVRVDKGDFQDALVNLALNARDAMPLGGNLTIETSVANPADVRIADAPAGPCVQIAVTDNGTGMPDKVKARIFEPFFSTKGKEKGTGLGLPMVYGFVKRSGGAITVDTKEGFGTTFRIYLPISDRQPAMSADVPAIQAPVPKARNNGQILIVDDEADLAEFAQTTLQDCGYRTLVAHSGEEALELLKRNHQVVLVLTDVIMPGKLDGYALADAVQKFYPDIKICLASGFAEAPSTSGRRLPVIAKPYTGTDLTTMVCEVLSPPEHAD